MNIDKLKTLRDQVANTNEFSMRKFATCIVGVAIRNSDEFRHSIYYSYAERIKDNSVCDYQAALAYILECNYAEAEMIIYAQGYEIDYEYMTHQNAVQFLDELIAEYSEEIA